MRRNGRKLALLAVFVFLFQIIGHAQPTGGRSKLDFLQLPAQAKSNAIGANHFTANGADPALFLQSPTQLDTSKTDHVSASIMPYLADTKLMSLAYAKELKRSGGVWGVGIQYLNYGTMTETDAIGNVIGEFRAADYGLSAGYGHSIGAFTLGGTVKMVGASVDSYQTWGIAFDWGGVFKHPKEDLTVGFVVKNLGFLKQNFYGAVPPLLPFDIRAGLSLKPEYMPIRFSVTAHHLNKFDMVYNDPNLFYSFDTNGNKLGRKISIAEKLGRHLAVGVEALIHPKFRLLLGYDHLRRQELRLVDKGALAGFSFGAWLKIKKFELGYGRSQYTPDIGSSSLSIVMDLSKKKSAGEQD
jgi:hypothetical protein